MGKFMMEDSNVQKKRELFPSASVIGNVSHVPKKRKGLFLGKAGQWDMNVSPSR